jgi:hypothetical protein
MSQGAVIGIAVGVTGGVLFLVAAGLVFWFVKRFHRTDAGQNQSAIESLRSTTLSPGPYSEPGEPKSPISIDSQPVNPQMRGVYEADARLLRVEMANDNGRFELDQAGHGNAELETTRDGPVQVTEAPALHQPVPTKPKDLSPMNPDTPQSPPPEYTPHQRTGGGD